jgi:WW domain-containing oxidoreductase
MRTASILVGILSVLVLIYQQQGGFLVKYTAEEVSEGFDLRGQTGIVTGANTGIGQETARVFALRGMHVIMACRSEKKGLAARDEVIASLLEMTNESREELEKRVEVMLVDLASLASVKSFAESFVMKNIPLHYMVLNAGLNSQEKSKTVDGLEMVSGANWIGHFYMCNLLFNQMKAAANNSHTVRVVHVSSAAQ